MRHDQNGINFTLAIITERLFFINVNSQINIVQLVVHNLERMLAKINFRNYHFRVLLKKQGRKLESMHSNLCRFQLAFRVRKCFL